MLMVSFAAVPDCLWTKMSLKPVIVGVCVNRTKGETPAMKHFFPNSVGVGHVLILSVPSVFGKQWYCCIEGVKSNGYGINFRLFQKDRDVSMASIPKEPFWFSFKVGFVLWQIFRSTISSSVVS